MNKYKKQIEEIIEEYHKKAQALHDTRNEGTLSPEYRRPGDTPETNKKPQAQQEKINDREEVLLQETKDQLQEVARNAPNMLEQKRLSRYAEDRLAGKIPKEEQKEQPKSVREIPNGYLAKEFHKSFDQPTGSGGGDRKSKEPDKDPDLNR